MKLVIDSNRVVASLIRDSTTREILYDKRFNFIAPEFIKTEIKKYEEEIIRKAHITENEFELLLSIVLNRVVIIPQKDYQSYLNELKTEIQDKKDIPYLAACLAAKAEGIWTHDPHFLEQDKVKVYTNKDLLAKSRR